MTIKKYFKDVLSITKKVALFLIVMATITVGIHSMVHYPVYTVVISTLLVIFITPLFVKNK